MSTTPNENTTVPEAPIFEPFPKPQTMPSGWDLSEFAAQTDSDFSSLAEQDSDGN